MDRSKSIFFKTVRSAYITEVLTKTTTGKIAHRCILLHESYREHGKVKTRALANLTHCAPTDVAAVRWALQYKQALLSPAVGAGLLERLERDALSADDRHVLGHLMQVMHTYQQQHQPLQPTRRVTQRQATRTRTVAKGSRRRPRRAAGNEPT
jgi:hypothetical protein